MIDLGVTPEDILHSVGGQRELYKLFGVDPKIGKAVSSPLRSDRTPSCKFFISSKGDIMLHDHTINKSYNVFTFIGEKYGLQNMSEVLDIIIKKIGGEHNIKKELFPSYKKHEKNINKNVKTELRIEILTPDENIVNYFNNYCYHITAQELKNERIFKLKNLWKIYGKSAKKISYEDETLAIAYVFKDTFKVYAPFSKTKKWICNTSKHDIFGLHVLEKGETLTITSSQKDRLALIYTTRFLWNKPINVIAPQSESVLLDKKEINYIKSLGYKNLNIVYDFDKAGKYQTSVAKEYYDKYFNCSIINIPDIIEIDSPLIKDMADVVSLEPKWKIKKLTEKML